ncbi:hypothetical protein L596_030380 [Steinernema carpocapsae]|uniref:Uncharacterized protein n=1 Tax=Steinernema carpocapsae TaxID=34508 RepID=A0A4V5ZWX7_STECR|nr:hypothetical protein L596_030380 [Steinernema carpocapsae]
MHGIITTRSPPTSSHKLCSLLNAAKSHRNRRNQAPACRSKTATDAPDYRCYETVCLISASAVLEVSVGIVVVKTSP